MRFAPLFALALAAGGCGDVVDDIIPPDGAAPDLAMTCDPSSLTLAMDLRRVKPGSTFQVLVTADRCGPAPGLTIDLQIAGGKGGPLSDGGNGTYGATVTPDAMSGEVTVTATSGMAKVTRTAVVLPMVSTTWDQPERVGGLVNSAGWEDSARISPDGAWLMVGAVSPIDVPCCTTTACGGPGNDPKSPFCQTVLGPYQAPERPQFPGAARVVDASHVTNACPSLGMPPTGEANTPLPLTASYLFHLQPDGSFAEPQFIGFDADGCAAPFGWAFANMPTQTGAHMVFAYNDPRDAAKGDTHNHLYFAPIQFGVKNSLATYSWSQQAGITVDVFVPFALAVPPMPPDMGNPMYWNDRIWFDDDALPEHDLWFAAGMKQLPNTQWMDPLPVGLTEMGKAEGQPFMDEPRLYFIRDGAVYGANLVNQQDPSLANSWSAPDLELAAEGGARAGAVTALRYPSVSHGDDGQFIYFVYVLKTQDGFDANVGRARFR